MNNIDLFKKKMQTASLSDKIIDVFSYYYSLFIAGEKGKLSKKDIDLPTERQVISYTKLNNDSYNSLQKLAVIKLNGGLGTSMGLSKAKSLLPVKDNNTFLDIIANQILFLRNKYTIDIPLIFMNSFNTSKDTVTYLEKYPSLRLNDIPLEFIQNKFPKIEKDTNKPYENIDDSLTWNPPGHGDIYNVLNESDLIDVLLERGIEYLFISNSDNLGAVVDTKILNEMIEYDIDFVMEVCNRTEMDKKGGHLAKKKGGELVLREVAQCPDEEIDEFQDIKKYKYFNTNNLWIKLSELKKLLIKYKGILPLPLILNAKKVSDTPVIQFETAMGSAISLFEKAKAVCVPRNRFLPVKKTPDLLMLWSDIYYLDDDFIIKKRDKDRDIVIELDDEYFGSIEDFSNAFIDGIPSLIDCQYLKIVGNVKFGQNVKFSDKIELITSSESFLSNIHIKGI